jgi:toxin FitB
VKWLLDTNVVSETGKRHPNARVVEWLTAQTPDELAISIITVAELRAGALAHSDVERRRELLQWIDATTSTWLAERCVAVTVEILTDWLQVARLLAAKGTTRQSPDLLVAATARIHNLTVVTRNVRDFIDTGVRVYDPWTTQTHIMDAP